MNQALPFSQSECISAKAFNRYLSTLMVKAVVNQRMEFYWDPVHLLHSWHWTGVSPHTSLIKRAAEACVLGGQSGASIVCDRCKAAVSLLYTGCSSSRSFEQSLPSSLRGLWSHHGVLHLKTCVGYRHGRLGWSVFLSLAWLQPHSSHCKLNIIY